MYTPTIVSQVKDPANADMMFLTVDYSNGKDTKQFTHNVGGDLSADPKIALERIKTIMHNQRVAYELDQAQREGAEAFKVQQEKAIDDYLASPFPVGVPLDVSPPPPPPPPPPPTDEEKEKIAKRNAYLEARELVGKYKRAIEQGAFKDDDANFLAALIDLKAKYLPEYLDL